MKREKGYEEHKTGLRQPDYGKHLNISQSPPCALSASRSGRLEAGGGYINAR